MIRARLEYQHPDEDGEPHVLDFYFNGNIIGALSGVQEIIIRLGYPFIKRLVVKEKKDFNLE